MPKIKVKNLDDFYATYSSLIVRFSGKNFPKLSKSLSKLVVTKLGEFIINPKRENQFEDPIFTWNISDREILGLQYLGGYVILNFYKKLRNSTKSLEFQQSMALLSACRLTNTEMLQNQKLVSAVNRGGL